VVIAVANMSSTEVVPELSDYDVSATTGFALENPEVSGVMNFTINSMPRQLANF